MPEKDKYLLQSVSNTLQVLKLLSKNDNLGVAEISKLSGFDKASTFRMLYTLEKFDFVEKTSDAKYRLGLKFLYYGAIVSERQNLIEIARPAMKRACERCYLPFHISILEHGRAVTIHKEEPSGDIQITARVGMSVPAYCTALGRVLLANLPKAEQEEQLAKYDIHIYSERSIRSVEELRLALQQILQRGYDVENNDRFAGFGCVAVPVVDHRGNCIASLGIVTLAQRIEHDYPAFIRELNQTSHEISVALGF